MKWPTRTPSASGWACIQCRPALTAHPHCEQSGSPPRNRLDACLKIGGIVHRDAGKRPLLRSGGRMQESLDGPVWENQRRIFPFERGYSSTSRRRDSGVSVSALCSPRCGV